MGSISNPMARSAAIVRGLKALGAVPALQNRISGRPMKTAAALPIMAPSMLRRELPVQTTTIGSVIPGR